MTMGLHEFTWESVAAVATLAAVVVALFPIWRDALRRKAHARGLRIRLCSKLSLLRPSLVTILRDGHAMYPDAVLKKEEFRYTVSSIAVMMQELSVLDAQEQDKLGMAFANLEMTAGLYGSKALTVDTAKHVLALIDSAVSVMEKRGLLHRPLKAPWESGEKELEKNNG